MIASIARDDAMGQLDQPTLDVRGGEDKTKIEMQGRARQSMYGWREKKRREGRFSGRGRAGRYILVDRGGRREDGGGESREQSMETQRERNAMAGRRPGYCILIGCLRLPSASHRPRSRAHFVTFSHFSAFIQWLLQFEVKTLDSNASSVIYRLLAVGIGPVPHKRPNHLGLDFFCPPVWVCRSHPVCTIDSSTTSLTCSAFLYCDTV